MIAIKSKAVGGIGQRGDQQNVTTKNEWRYDIKHQLNRECPRRNDDCELGSHRWRFEGVQGKKDFAGSVDQQVSPFLPDDKNVCEKRESPSWKGHIAGFGEPHVKQQRIP